MQTSYFEIPTTVDGAPGGIWAAHDHGPAGPWSQPLVVLCPGFERRGIDSLGLAVHLVANGLETIRFDATNAPGLSTGAITAFTLSSAISDIHHVLGYVRKHGGSNVRLGCVAISLSARALLRYIADHGVDAGLRAAATVVGVVSVEHTISCILGYNALRRYKDEGARYGVRKLVTYELDWDRFIADAWQRGLADLDGTLADARRCAIEDLASVVTGADEWVPGEHSDAFHAAFAGPKVARYMIEGASHKLWKNPRTIDVTSGCLVRFFHRALRGAEPEHVLAPPITEVFARNHVERRYLLEVERSRA